MAAVKTLAQFWFGPSPRWTAAGIARRLLLPCLLLLATGCYWEILHTFFVQDDFMFLRAAQEPAPNWAMFQGVCFFRPLSSYWLPLLNLSLWGLNPFWHHATYFALFLATLWFLYDWLGSLTGSVAAAMAGTVLYAFSKTHLYTLAWIAGGIDVSAALFFVVSLWAIDRYLNADHINPKRQRGTDDNIPRLRFGLLSTVPRWRFGLVWVIGIAFVCGLLCKESCVVLVPVCLVWIMARKMAARRPLEPAERKVLLVLFAILAVYLPLWKAANTEAGEPASQFQCDPWRGMIVLRHSVIAVLPAAEADLPQKNKWVLVPLVLAALAAARRRGLAERAVLAAMGLSLWILPAALFALTKYPWDLQLYYSHFSVFGLSLLAALAVGRMLDAARGAKTGTVPYLAAALAVVWLALAGQTIRDGIRHRASPALGEAAVAQTIYEQLDAEFRARPFRRVVFLSLSPDVWAPMHNGDMLRVLFPGIQADYAGWKGFQPPRDLRTSLATLVVRSDKQNLTVVR